MAASDVDICNSALAKLGASRIKSMTEGSKEAALCNLRYKDCRDVVLQSHPWKCCITRKILSPLANAPAFGYASAFRLPPDYLRQLPKDKSSDLLPVEDGCILSDDSELKLRYVYRNEDTTKYPPHLSEAIAQYLAQDICYALTQSATKEELQFKKYETVLRRARFLDSSDSKAQTKDSDTFLDARLSGGGA